VFDSTDGADKPTARRCLSQGNQVTLMNGQSDNLGDIYIPPNRKRLTNKGKNISNNCGDDGNKRTKKDSTGHGHKRSRSDMSGIKHGGNQHPMVFNNALANDNSGSQSDSTLVDPALLSQEGSQYTGYGEYDLHFRIMALGSPVDSVSDCHPDGQGSNPFVKPSLVTLCFCDFKIGTVIKHPFTCLFFVECSCRLFSIF